MPCFAGTDFSKAEQGDLSTAPVRFIKTTRLKKRKLAPGDLLVELSGGSKDQPTGRIMLVKSELLKRAGHPVVFTNFVKRLRLKDTIRSDYFRLYWEFLYAQDRTRIYEKRTTGIRNFKLKDFLANEFIPLPPLPEQRTIAYVLRTVQRAKEATERVIAALKELKKSLMKHLFTYGPVSLDQADQVPLKETEIGPVPEHWRVVRLGEVVQKPQYGFTASAVDRPVGPKLLRITDIQNGHVNWHTVPYCEIDDQRMDKYRLKMGDILFARIGATTGKSFLITECPNAVFASYLIRVRTNRELLLPEFLYYFTQGNSYWDQINAAKGGRLKKGINIPVLSSLKLPLPSLPEQRKIVSLLQTMDRRIETEEKRRKALEVMFRTMLHHLMTGKIRVWKSRDWTTYS